MKRKGFLASGSSFEVRESAVKLVAKNSSTPSPPPAYLEVWVGRPDVGEWVALMHTQAFV